MVIMYYLFSVSFSADCPFSGVTAADSCVQLHRTKAESSNKYYCFSVICSLDSLVVGTQYFLLSVLRPPTILLAMQLLVFPSHLVMVT